jgi:hypothetical protein
MIERLKTLDWEKWLKNTAIFSAPFALVFLGAVKSGADLKDALYILYLFGIDVFIDLIKKFIATNQSK